MTQWCKKNKKTVSDYTTLNQSLILYNQYHHEQMNNTVFSKRSKNTCNTSKANQFLPTDLDIEPKTALSIWCHSNCNQISGVSIHLEINNKHHIIMMVQMHELSM